MHESSFRDVAGTIALLGASLGVGCSNAPTAPIRLGPPTALHIITGNAQTGDQNQVLPVPLTVQTLDTAGGGVPGVKVDWNVTAGGGTLLAQAFPTVTDSTGLVIVFWQLGPPLDGAQGATAACCNGLVATFTAQAVFPLGQRLGVINGWQQSDTVGRTLAASVVAVVLRADGKPDVGAVVGWRTHSSGGHFSPTFVRADSAGRAATQWTLGTVAGAETSWAVVAGLPPAYVVATALPGPPVQVTITPVILPFLGPIGDTALLSAHAWDQYGNLVPGPPPLRTADTSIARVSGNVVEARHHGSTWIVGQAGVVGDSVPITVLGFSSVSDGGGHTCGLSLAGDAYCWGENSQGSIGDGTLTARPHPVPIGRGLGLQVPFTDSHTCALTASGQAYCWGPDQHGELGDGSPTYATEVGQTLPVPVAGGHLFSSISAGRIHTCAVATSGDACCWGDNFSGELGRDTLTGTCLDGSTSRCSDWPILVAGGLEFTQVSAGRWAHSCGIATGGAAYCWGLNDTGELGNDSTTDMCGGVYAPYPCSRAPQLVAGGLVFKSVTAGRYFTCGLGVTGDGYCWGYGIPGNLGDGRMVSSATPVKVAGGLTFADLQTGPWNACGLTTTGKLYCWGSGYGGTPVPVLPNLLFSTVAPGGDVGFSHVCALTTDNDLYCLYTTIY